MTQASGSGTGVPSGASAQSMKKSAKICDLIAVLAL
jgi:hypothetical protein